jgi:hypothetical protein
MQESQPIACNRCFVLIDAELLFEMNELVVKILGLAVSTPSFHSFSFVEESPKLTYMLENIFIDGLLVAPAIRYWMSYGDPRESNKRVYWLGLFELDSLDLSVREVQG